MTKSWTESRIDKLTVRRRFDGSVSRHGSDLCEPTAGVGRMAGCHVKLSYLGRQTVSWAADASLCIVPTRGSPPDSDIGNMTSKTPTGAKPLPIEQSYTSLDDAFQQALALELMLAQQARAKDPAQAGIALKPD